MRSRGAPGASWAQLRALPPWVSRREGWLDGCSARSWPEAFRAACRAEGGSAGRLGTIAKREGTAPGIGAGPLPPPPPCSEASLPRSTRGYRWSRPRVRRLTGRSALSALLNGCFRDEGPLLPAALASGRSELSSRCGHGQVPGADRPGGRPGAGPRLRPRAAAGVRSQPSGRRDTRADGRPVLGRLQPLRDQPAGSSADPQRLHAQSGGDPEELRAFI